MNLYSFPFFLALASLLTFFVVTTIGLVVKDKPPVRTETVYEWVLPARFDKQGGSFAIGCAFWSVPTVEQYSETNPDVGLGRLYFGPTEFGGVFGVSALIDGPVAGPYAGTVAIYGENCAISVDWSVFPRAIRPAPGD